MLKRFTTRLSTLKFVRPTFNQTVRYYSNELSSKSLPLTYGADPIVRYTENHEWIACHKDSLAFVGITKYAADALGDTTFVEVNDPPAEVEANDSLGSVESVKSASDVYTPVNGTLIERNEALISEPSLLNKDPMGEAWLAKIQVSNQEDLENLLTLEQYKDSLEDH